MPATRNRYAAPAAAGVLVLGALVAAVVLVMSPAEPAPDAPRTESASRALPAPNLAEPERPVEAASAAVPRNDAPTRTPVPPAERAAMSTGDLRRQAWPEAPKLLPPGPGTPPTDGRDMGLTAVRVPRVAARAPLTRRRAPRDAGAAAAAGPARLTVRARASEDDAPLGRCAVRLEFEDASRLALETDAEGRAATELAGSGRVSVRVTAPDRVRVDRREIAFAPGDVLEIDATLPLGTSAVGTVGTTDDGPVAGALLEFFAEDAWWDALKEGADPFAVAEGLADANGDVAVAGLPRAATLVWRATAPGFASVCGTVETTIAIDDSVRVPVRLQPGCDLAVDVVDADGDAVANALVYATPGESLSTAADTLRGVFARADRLSWAATARVHDARRSHRVDVLLGRVRTDTRGSAVVAGLPPAVSYVVHAERPPIDRSAAVSCTAGTGLVRLRLAPLVPVCATVRSDGRALGRCDVSFESWPGRSTRQTSGDGVTTAVLLPALPLRIEVFVNAFVDGGYVGVPYATGGTNFVVDAEQVRTVSGKVVDERDEPVGGATIRCGRQTASSDLLGQFELSGVSPWEREVTAAAPAHTSRTLLIGSGDERAVRLALARTGAVRVHVAQIPSGIVPAWHRMLVRVGADSRIVEGLGPPPDAFVVRDVPVGRALIGVVLAGTGCGWSTCDVAAGETSDADPLTVPRGLLVRVHVESPANLAITHSVVHVRPLLPDAQKLSPEVHVLVGSSGDAVLELPWGPDDQLEFRADAPGHGSSRVVRNTSGGGPVVIRLLKLR